MAKGTFGERLKREREMREVLVEEISKATRISGRYLQALENEDWAKLPGGVFARGFVRTIARFLGLDEDDLLAEYDLARGKETPPLAAPPQGMDTGDRARWVSAGILLLVLIALAAGAVYGWRRYSAHRTKQTPSLQTPSSGTHAVSSAPRKASPSYASDSSAISPTSTSPDSEWLDLTVSTSAATRVRVIADGSILQDAELPAGENRRFRAKERFEVTADDSSAVLLELNGRAMPPIGAPGASGTIVLTRQDLERAPGGSTQP